MCVNESEVRLVFHERTLVPALIPVPTVPQRPASVAAEASPRGGDLGGLCALLGAPRGIEAEPCEPVLVRVSAVGHETEKSLPRNEGKKRAMSNDIIELNFKADTFEEAISQAIVAALGSGMSPREIIAQLIARGFLRDPGNNALEDVVRGLADMADQLRRDPAAPI